MNKKSILLGLAAISAALFMLPSVASATLIPLHMVNPVPAKLDVAGVGNVTMRSIFGTTTCNGVTGTMTPENSTRGTMTLRFGGKCALGNGQCTTSTNPPDSSGFITTTSLSYHFVTLDTPTPSAPGLLVTPGSNETFAHLNCFFGLVPLKGNGWLGTISSPACGRFSSTTTLSFKASGGTTTQEHRSTEGSSSEKTTGPWSLSLGGNPASLEVHATLTATDALGNKVQPELQCT